MNEFCQRYAKMSREHRVRMREEVIARVIYNFPMSIKGNHTDAQLRAAARKKVDMAIAQARKMA